MDFGSSICSQPADQNTKGPQFFKVYIPDLCANRLRIPPAYVHNIENECLGVISLKGPSGNLWSVELVEHPGGLYFASGWKEFVGDNLIENGDFLIFRREGPSCFFVGVFGSSGCEKKECLVAKPCKKEYEIVPFGTDDESGNKIMELQNGSHARLCRPDDDVNVGRKRKIKSFRYLVDKSCNNGLESNMINTNGTPLSMKVAGSGSENAKVERLKLIKSSEMQRRGQIIARVQKTPCLTSRRRTITDEERDKTLQMANSFKSDKPCVKIIMRESYVYNGFFLHMPSSFAREHMPEANQKITLWDPSGQQWPVTYLIYENRYSGLSGGWSGFSIAHNLEKDDVCIFELVDQENIKVHIFRVLEKITPYLRNKLRSI